MNYAALIQTGLLHECGKSLHISLLGVSLIPAYRNFIAIVDDEPDIAYLFKLALSDNGFDIMAFTDPVAALEHVEHNHAKYKLVLSDVKMPVMDGIELTKRIADKDRSILLLLMSAFDRPEVLSQVDGMEVDFIQKPIPVEKLKQIISSKLGH